jgi:hypothetical protein
VAISFAEAKAIVRAAEESTWTPGTYQIEDEGFEDATHYLVVRVPQRQWVTIRTSTSSSSLV